MWFRQGQPAERLTFLIDPEDEFDGFNTSIHRINGGRWPGGPLFATRCRSWPTPSPGRWSSTSAFDRVVIGRASARLGLPEIDCGWLGSCRLARRAWFNLPSGYGMAALASILGIGFRRHDAGEEALAAGTIVVRACSEAGFGLEEAIAIAIAPVGGIGGESATRAVAGNPDGPLYGEVVVFTGTLTMPRWAAGASVSYRYRYPGHRHGGAAGTVPRRHRAG